MAAPEEEEMNSSSSPETEIGGKILCSPCDADGTRLEAIGYCVNCKEYLCEVCFKYHRRPSIARKHVLLSQEQMGSVAGRDNSCPEHEKRAIEYHCPTHAFLGCHVCFYQHQKTCKNTRYIQDVAKTLTSSQEFQEFSTKLDYVATKTKHLISNAKRNSESVDSRHTEKVASIKAFKLQVLEAVDRLEKDLINKADRIKDTEIAKWNAILGKCTSIQEANLVISTEIEVLQNRNKNDDLYLAMIKSKDKLLSLEDELNADESYKTDQLFTYEGNTELLELLKSPWGLGKLVNSNAISNTEHVTDINVKTGNDTRGCCIRGSAMMPEGKLVIGDWNNMKVKLLDIREHKDVSEMKLSNSPWCVAKMTDTTVAVTVPGDKKILFVRTDPTLSVDRELDVKEMCHGVAYCEGKLVVTFCGEKKVEVMDLQGTVLRDIETDDNGKALFPYPFTVAVDPKLNVMYVSNASGDHTVVCLKLDGAVLATYKDDELEYPQQAVVDSTGMVFVLGCSSKNVHLITSDCKKVKVLLKSTDGLAAPETISYDESRRKLYVGDGNSLKVYRVSYTAL